MMLLAQSATFMGVEISTLVAVAGALGVFYKLWRKMCAIEKDVAERVKALIMAEAAEADKQGQIKPQPLIVSMAKEFVARENYNVHCEINRSEHARLEREFDAEVEKVKDMHHSLAREVSGVAQLANTTNASIVLLGEKVDNFIMELRREKK